MNWSTPTPTPSPGINPEYDKVIAEISLIQSNMDVILDSIRSKFNNPSIVYSHSRFPYQLEIPEHLVKGSLKPDAFEFTSSKAGFQRFHTTEIKINLNKLEILQKETKKLLFNFLKDLYQTFKENFLIWGRIIAILAELDCLCSLSKVSFDFENPLFPLTKPIFHQKDYKEAPVLKVKDLFHPCLVKKGVIFRPLSIDFNRKGLNQPETILLTGPNMGGKSTLLRSLGVMSIMAHLGCYVPAKRAELTLIKGIFTKNKNHKTIKTKDL